MPANGGPKDGQRFFFVHVQRTGGTTLGWHAVSTFGRDAVYPRPDPNAGFLEAARAYSSVDDLLAMNRGERERVRFLAGHFPFVVASMIDEEIVTMTVLRDPVARALSLLKQAQAFRGDDSLEDIYDTPGAVRRVFGNHQTKIFSMIADEASLGYAAELEMDEERLANAKANLDRVDLLGFHDDYAGFLSSLQERFGWTIGEIPLQNASPTREIPDGLVDRIVADNLFDLELIEYAKSRYATT